MAKKKNDTPITKTAPTAKPTPKKFRIPRKVWLILLGICGFITALGGIYSNTPEYRATLAARTEIALQSTQTAAAMPTNTPPPTPTITNTPPPTEIPPTATPTATATITDTPAPRAAIATATPMVVNTPQPTILTTYYIKSQANVRACPQTSCEILVTLTAGVPIISDAVVQGDAVETGNTTWYQTTYNGRTAYVYSTVVQLTAPVTTTTNQSSPTTNQSSPSTNNAAPSTIIQGGSCAGFDTAVCPSYYPAPANCEEVVARGIPSRIAACCFPARDGDEDGEACYGT